MIVLKSVQDKVLAILQSVAGLIGRRHALPVLKKRGFPELAPVQ